MSDTKLGIIVGVAASVVSSVVGLDPHRGGWWLCTFGIIIGFWVVYIVYKKLFKKE